MGFLRNLFKKREEENIELTQDPIRNEHVEKDIADIKSGNVTKVYPILKPGDWIGLKAGALRQAIMGTKDDPNLVVGFGYDAPNNFVFLNYSEYNEPEQLEKVVNEAYSNLSQYEVELNEVVPNKVIIIDGKDFCSEKILDVNFMKGLQEKMGGTELVVSIPRRRCMMVTNSFNEEAISNQFMSVHYNTWNDDSYGNAPILNALFRVIDGEIESIKEL